MITNVQDCSDGITLTADGAIAEGELVYLTSAGKAKTRSDEDHVILGVAPYAIADAAEGTILPFVPGKQYWVLTAEAITVGESVFPDTTAFKTVAGTAIGTAQTKRIGVCVTAGAQAALCKIVCTQANS